MKLSMSMIEAYLSQYSAESNIQSDTRTIRGMRFLTEHQLAYSPDYIYIGEAADYFRDPAYSSALILASGRSHIVCKGPLREDLLNSVLAAFDHYNAIEHRLNLAVSQHDSLSAMMEIVGDALADPVLVFGIDGTFLAGSHVEDLSDQKLLGNIRNRKSLGAEILGMRFQDDAGAIQHDLSFTPQATHGPDGQTAVNAYIRNGKETIGFVMCFPLDRNHVRLAMHIEGILLGYLPSALEFNDASSPHQALHLALADLLKGAEISASAAQRLASAAGGSSNFHVLLVRSLGIQNHTQRTLLAKEVSASDTPCIATGIDQNVALLTSAPYVRELTRQILSRIDVSNAAIGISMEAAGIDHVNTAYRQAEFACNVSDDAGVRYCHDLALPYLLRTLRNEPSVQDLLHPAIEALASYDENHSTALLQTLKAYVGSGLNQVQAARAIHVHLNTLKYRIGRIEELTSIDFKDPDDMLYLQLSLKII